MKLIGVSGGTGVKGAGGTTLFDLPVIGEDESPVEFHCRVDEDGVCRWDGCPAKNASGSDSDRFCSLPR
jgi:hypothetical protein